MKSKILLTSFRTWLPHHKSNSADDLLEVIQHQNDDSLSLSFIRNLPVDTALASHTVIEAIENIKPNVVVCCGMAESRTKLTIESRAFCEEICLKTSVDLETLKCLLAVTNISHDAGKFVCEGLYYQVLKYSLKHKKKYLSCLFVHVPLISANNLESIKQDFKLILNFLSQST